MAGVVNREGKTRRIPLAWKVPLVKRTLATAVAPAFANLPPSAFSMASADTPTPERLRVACHPKPKA